MTKKKNTPSFEESIGQLEALVTSLEAGDLSLEESLSTFEQGIKLTKDCQQQLNEAEQKVSLLVGDGDTMQLVDFDSEPEN
jgi:exodeoxyribonuclease VII small subunit